MLRTLLLAPLSWLYGLAVGLRNLLYDEHLLPSVSVSVPTVCVGNLAMGGTGKTPHVEYLVRLLAPHYKVAVLSRGYKRRTRGFRMADAQSTAATIGDEAMQLHTTFPDLPIAVCKNRLRGIQTLRHMVDGLQVVILDDAFQHRALRSGYNILLTRYDKLYVHDHMLPLGTLRDTPRQSLRAHAVVVTKCPENMRPIDKRVVDNALHLPTFQHLFFSRLQYPEIALSGTPLLVTGIGHPEPLLAHLRTIYPATELLAYPDHHRFRKRDVEEICARAERFACVVTTEKDYQRMLLTDLPERLGERLHVLPIEVRIDDNDLFDSHILRYVSETLRTQRHPESR